MTEIPLSCFDVDGNVACFRCYPGDMDGEFIVVPATRDPEHVRMAYVEHALFAEHDIRPVLCMRGTDEHIHAWQWPE